MNKEDVALAKEQTGIEAQTEIVEMKDFTYRLPKKLGNAFKLWCQTNGDTAQSKLSELLSEYMDGKEIVIRYSAD